MKNDVAAERFVLSVIAQLGLEAYEHVNEILTKDCFSNQNNRLIYTAFEETFAKYDNIDLNLFLSICNDLGYDQLVTNKKEQEFIKTLFFNPISDVDYKKLAIKLRKLEIAKKLQQSVSVAYEQLNNVTGEEELSDIIQIVDAPVNQVNTNINSDNQEATSLMFEEAEDMLEYIEENPVDQVGLSSGFRIYDEMIGGGFRKGYINLIVARPKSRKSTLAIQIGENVARTKVPVLYLDTEMDKETSVLRRLSALSRIDYNKLERGLFVNDPKRDILYQKAKEVKNIPLYYRRIAGKSFDEVMAIIKKWIKSIGLDEYGRTKDCLIIYDYFKLMNTKDMQDLKEHQAMGFQLSTLTDFLGNNQVPCLAFVQANRDGISKETTDIVSQSDRLVWFCASLTLLRKKTVEEIAAEGVVAGDTKLVPMDGMRFGKGINGRWINYAVNNFQFKELGTDKQCQDKIEVVD